MVQRDTHEIIELYTSTMNEVNRRISVIMNEEVHQELTTDQFSTLCYLRANQPCTSTDIAHEFSIGKSAVTAQVNRLFDRGFITRTRDHDDRRIVYLSLTEEGSTIVQEGKERLYEVLGNILSDFSQEDIEHFIQTLQKLVHSIREKY
ncbi:MarR family winged helix-turn-helix transcriptional regulator [Radiobacillus sp. PE A8.2]|uniref:MarR family winged helix-turn-helix transcriptional regulator n=1 Tax=Radiobacillus sp. PE A8.2 TaxID=3380349 RepID=UPI00388E6278